MTGAPIPGMKFGNIDLDTRDFGLAGRRHPLLIIFAAFAHVMAVAEARLLIIARPVWYRKTKIDDAPTHVTA